MDNIEINTDKTLELEFTAHDERHGICNVLRHNLMNNDNIEYAVYNIDHPLTGEPNMTIKTKRGKRPRTELKKAANDLKKDIEEFKNLIETEL